MHPEKALPAVPSQVVLPLTRPVVAATLAALTAGGASLFLAGLAAGLGWGGGLYSGPHAPAAPAEAINMERDSSPAPHRLVIGHLPAAGGPEADSQPPVPMAELTATIAAAPPPTTKPAPAEKLVAVATDTDPAVPATRVTWATTDGGRVIGTVASDGDGVSAPVAAQGSPMRYAIQTGAFGVAVNAERQTAELRRLGFTPHTLDHVSARGIPLTVVYAGRYDSRTSAETMARTLQKAGIQTHVTALAD